MNKNLFSFYTLMTLLIAGSALAVSCKKWVVADAPAEFLAADAVFESDATATGAMLGIYIQMMQSGGSNYFPNGAPTVFLGLASDEFAYGGTTSSYKEFFANELTVTNTNVDLLWNSAYNYIYLSNAILDGLAGQTNVSANLKQQLTGEAKFVRALCHFYLVNLFGDIPLVTSSDYRVNSLAVRSSSSLVYQQILKDLQDAKTLLPVDFALSNGERTRPNKWAASALLARVYLYLGDLEMAESESSGIIEETGLFKLASSPGDVFLKNSAESIWQLMPIVPSTNYSVQDAYFMIPNTVGNPPIRITPSLLAAFEPGDSRVLAWLDSTVYRGQTFYYPFKYKQKFNQNTSEYYTVLRLGEQYLIRAEARARQNHLSESIQDLNTVRNRASLVNLPSTLTQTEVLDTILHERRVEFFAEWGQRWFDLKRTGSSNRELAPLKSGWQQTDTLLPIPQKEIQNDPQLTQNAGY